MVRDLPGVKWAEADTFQDADGTLWTVEGVSRPDRGRTIEVLARRLEIEQ